jgi:hypothetical protein
MNAKTPRTHLTGAVVGGLGMVLTEEAVMDHRIGRFGNREPCRVSRPRQRRHSPAPMKPPTRRSSLIENVDLLPCPPGFWGVDRSQLDSQRRQH